MTLLSPSALTLAVALALPAAAQAVCTSDGLPQPVALLERFINADCDACWQDPATPAARPGEIAIDWILPGAKGDDAPLAMGASRDGLARLEALRRTPPAQADAVRSRRAAQPPALRLAQGQPFNDYIGASIELRPGPAQARGAWLLLVEALPAGAEGSPVPRNLVRNVFRPGWESRPLRGAERRMLKETRAMQIHEGTKTERLRLVALVEDTAGRMRAIAATACSP